VHGWRALGSDRNSGFDSWYGSNAGSASVGCRRCIPGSYSPSALPTFVAELGTIDQQELYIRESLALNRQRYMLTVALYPEERCSFTERLP
jgi:hypothetical protein